MKKKHSLPPVEDLHNQITVINTISEYIKDKSNSFGALNILEAGCGRRWRLNLQGINYSLTGIDLD